MWLSAAGGVSVAYVFVHFLPELAASQAAVAEAAAGATGGLDLAGRHVFLIALTGLLTFYGLHRLAQTSRSRRQGEPVGSGRNSEVEAEARDAITRLTRSVARLQTVRRQLAELQNRIAKL